MCRLFAQYATPEDDAAEPLCGSDNALRAQSKRHPHGWGVAWYEAGTPRVLRGVEPAHEDGEFVEAARRARSHLVVAHVRDASVGRVAPENTHPFIHGRWVFAHNGTIARFRARDDVRAALEAEIDPALRRTLAGETDSERCFLAFLTRLFAALPAGTEPGLEDVRQALAGTVTLVARIADPEAEKPSSLNLLVTDGRLLAVCRRGRPLQRLERAEPGRVRLIVASERIGAGAWREVPEDTFLGVEAEGRVVERPLFDLVPRRAA